MSSSSFIQLLKVAAVKPIAVIGLLGLCTSCAIWKGASVLHNYKYDTGQWWEVDKANTTPPSGAHLLTVLQSFTDIDITITRNGIPDYIADEKWKNWTHCIYLRSNLYVKSSHYGAEQFYYVLSSITNGLPADLVKTDQRYEKRPMKAIAENRQTTTLFPERRWTLENIAVAEIISTTLTADETQTLTDVLQSALIGTQYFSILSQADIKAVLAAQNFSRSEACDSSQCLIEMGRILSVQKIIGGSVGKIGKTYSVSVRLVNVETGRAEFSVDRKIQSDIDDLLDLIKDAGAELALQYAARMTNNASP